MRQPRVPLRTPRADRSWPRQIVSPGHLHVLSCRGARSYRVQGARTSGIRWPQVRIEESGNPGSGVVRRLFIEAHPDQRATEQADDREHPGQRRILTRRTCERGQHAGMVVHEGVTDAWVDFHVIVDAVAVQDSLQPDRRVPTGRSRAP